MKSKWWSKKQLQVCETLEKKMKKSVKKMNKIFLYEKKVQILCLLLTRVASSVMMTENWFKVWDPSISTKCLLISRTVCKLFKIDNCRCSRRFPIVKSYHSIPRNGSTKLTVERCEVWQMRYWWYDCCSPKVLLDLAYSWFVFVIRPHQKLQTFHRRESMAWVVQGVPINI